MSNKGINYRTRLTDDEVREIRALHLQKGMGPSEIARLFKISATTAGRVAARRSYQQVPDLKAGAKDMCPCVKHTEERLCSVNIARARESIVAAVCLHCRGVAHVSVKAIESHGGNVRCLECGGERS